MWTVAPKTQRIPYPATESRVGVGFLPRPTGAASVPGPGRFASPASRAVHAKHSRRTFPRSNLALPGFTGVCDRAIEGEGNASKEIPSGPRDSYGSQTYLAEFIFSILQRSCPFSAFTEQKAGENSTDVHGGRWTDRSLAG